MLPEEIKIKLVGYHELLKTKDLTSEKAHHIKKDLLQSLFNQPLNLSEIKEILNINTSSLRKWRTRYGLEYTKKIPRNHNIFLDEDGNYLKEIAKECSKHGDTLHVRYSNRYRCKECIKDYSKVNKVGNAQAQQRLRDRQWALIHAYKPRVCSKCGYDEVKAAVDYHHVSSVNKKGTISEMIGKDIEEIYKELDKCVPLCANCHRKEHSIPGGYKQCPVHGMLADLVNCKSCRNNYKGNLRRKIRLDVINMFGGACWICKENYELNQYDFHHIIPKDKEFSIALMFINLNYKALSKELPKCALLCANCHRGVTVKAISSEIKPLVEVKEKGLYEFLAAYKIKTAKRRERMANNFCGCGNLMDLSAKTCKDCLVQPTVIDWPSIEKLLEELRTKPYTILAKELKVSDNGIRSQFKKLGIKPPRSRNLESINQALQQYKAVSIEL